MGACSQAVSVSLPMKPGSGHPTQMSKTSLRKQTIECVSTGFANKSRVKAQSAAVTDGGGVPVNGNSFWRAARDFGFEKRCAVCYSFGRGGIKAEA